MYVVLFDSHSRRFSAFPLTTTILMHVSKSKYDLEQRVVLAWLLSVEVVQTTLAFLSWFFYCCSGITLNFSPFIVLYVKGTDFVW